MGIRVRKTTARTVVDGELALSVEAEAKCEEDAVVEPAAEGDRR